MSLLLFHGAAGQTIAVDQASETDTAQTVSVNGVVSVGQASEADTAQAITWSRRVVLGQTSETDTAGTVSAVELHIIGQASETNVAQPIASVQPPPVLGQATELNRAQQVGVLGGVAVVSDAPVLIRAPRKAGRIFHEIVAPSGEGVHPSIGEWEAEEDAPGGFRAARGLVRSSFVQAHRDAFQAGSTWRTFLEDGTCIFAGWLKQSDHDGTMVQLSATGRAAIADREIGPILYQTHVGSEISQFSGDTDQWRVSFPTMSHTLSDTGIFFERTPDVALSGNAHVIIPFFGRDVAHLRMHVQGIRAFITVQTRQRVRSPSILNSAELDTSANAFENWYMDFPGTLTVGQAEIDLVLASGALPFPNTSVFDNYGDVGTTGWGFIWPDLITIEVTDGEATVEESASSVLLSNLEVNGSPLGRSRRYSVGDLVEDIAARLGFKDVRAESAYDITPYELPPGVPASEALDMACLISGRRYRILDTGSRPSFEFGHYNDHTWALASPWSPLRTIPEERFDAVAVPYSYPGTHGQLTDHVVVRAENSPLLRKRVNWDLDLADPSHNRDKAVDLAARLADDLVRPRFSGDFSAAEVVGPDGETLSAHHVNAGDVLQPWRRGEPGRLFIGRLVRFDDHVEGEFDGKNRPLQRMIARRERRFQDRKR